MTYEEAKKILDQVRDGRGAFFSDADINTALTVTGDLAVHEGVGSQRMDQEDQGQDWRARARERAILVGTNEKRHSQSPWRRWFAFIARDDGGRTC